MMKRTTLAGLALAAMIFGANAAPTSDTPAGTEQITVAKAGELLTALNALGQSHEEVVGQGNFQKVVPVPFSFSADTMWAISDNITALRKVITTYQETIRAMTASAEAKNGGPLKPLKEVILDGNNNVIKAEEPSPAQRALAAEIQKLYDSERPVAKLFRIKRGDLCLGGSSNAPSCPKDAANKISPPIISSLSMILER